MVKCLSLASLLWPLRIAVASCDLCLRQYLYSFILFPTLASSLEFVTGLTGLRKTQPLGPLPRPAPLNSLGWGVFFDIPCPCPHSGPHPTHTADRFRLKIGRNKGAPVQGMSAGGPWNGAGRPLPETYPPGAVHGPGPARENPSRPAPSRTLFVGLPYYIAMLRYSRNS